MENNKLKWILLSLVISLLSPLFSYSGNIIHKDGSVTIENEAIRFKFDASTGAIMAFTYLTSAIELLNDHNGHAGSPWEIALEKYSVSQKLDINNARTFHFSKTNDKTITLEWSNFSALSNSSFKVTVNVKIDDNQPFSKWHIDISGMQGEKLSKVTFPKIQGMKDMGNEELAIPSWMGELIKNPRGQTGGKPKTYSWSYPGPLSMQFLALYNKQTHGLYAAANDTMNYVKQFSLSVDSLNDLSYQMNNYPSFDSTLKSYVLPYDAIVGIFKGDWISAAMIYRKWGIMQKWCRESRFKNNTDNSWVEGTALWVWNRGRSGNVLTPAEDLKKKLGLPVNVLWHWWHGSAYDDGFPEYFPPKEGSGSFRTAVSEADKAGVKAIIYMNSFQWGTSTESFKKENALRWAVRDIHGDTKAHVFNIFTHHSLTPMCMATDYWRNKYASLADKAINEYHIGGIYMDQACLNLMCYNQEHGHSIGGGNYWVKSFGLLTKKIRANNSSDGKMVLAGEGCGEGWLPYLNALLTLQVSKERYAGVQGSETIPLFQAVYHQYGITFGSYSSLVSPPYDELWPKEDAPKASEQPLSQEFNEQFLMEQARSFAWGMQPTIANYHEYLSSEKSEEVNYLIRLAKIRYKALKYLLYGEFVQMPYIDIPEKDIPISRLSIYAGQKDRVTTFQKKVPLLYASAWKADDGSVGVALASISNSTLPVRFNFEAGLYGLPLSGKVFVIDAKGRKLFKTYRNGRVNINYSLPRRGICVIEIEPSL